MGAYEEIEALVEACDDVAAGQAGPRALGFQYGWLRGEFKHVLRDLGLTEGQVAKVAEMAEKRRLKAVMLATGEERAFGWDNRAKR
ncbi:hypothetical protein [Methylovulum miyakonense]|uniref:hypothetical protein n=1 Tax=Methylovulum miyakonense TaxID=645578 RepID=UPI0003666FCA|nr:hypothetical protein [Methylovulum miyakonense]